MEFLQLLPKRSVWVFMVIVTLAVGNGCNGCLEKERVALLQLKYSMNYSVGTSFALPSWEEDNKFDCCQWERVECDSTTRRVIKLSLNDTRGRYPLNGDYWDLNASILLPFESLRSLDLSMNQLRSFVGNEGSNSQEESRILKKLEVLDLHSNYPDDTIWSFLGGLSSIKTLDLSDTFDRYDGALHTKGLEILSNLSNLEDIDLRNNSFDNSILQSLNKLSSLRAVNLAGNMLNGSISVKEFDGLNNLKELDMSYNDITNLRALNHSGILNKLEVLHLSFNSLDETIWSFLGGHSSIKAMDLSGNDGLKGAFPRFCELKTLQELAIRGIGFGGTLPWCMVNLTSLQLLDITTNDFAGNIAQSPLINLTSLQYLAISYNNFEVPISFKSFFNHSDLKFISSFNNKLIDEDDFSAGSPSFQLLGLGLSDWDNVSITLSFPHFLYHQHDLIQVQLSRINFTGKFPYWLLENNTRIQKLVLTQNSFVGPLLLPSRQMRNLLALDISNNHLEGILPSKISVAFPNLVFLNMSTNNFKGKIPSSFGKMTSLKYLDLSTNGLSGEIPVQLAVYCRLLIVLRLSNNNFQGPVLPHQNNLTQLVTLHSDNNSFTEIPLSLSRSQLELLNVDANQLVGKIPAFIGNLPYLSMLTMAGNHLEGSIPIEFCQLDSLWKLDLSENNITGAIPSCFSSMSDIVSLRLSKNMLDGPFPLAFQEYDSFLEELDLSYNKFSGNIPTWIGTFSQLSVLLLQHNHFEGNIPKQVCNLTRLSLIDLSSNNLVGSIPPCISTINFHGLDAWIFDYYTDLGDTLNLMPRDMGMALLNDEGKFPDPSYRVSDVEEVEFATKGLSLSYKGKVLRLFSGINLSHNRLTGPIPPEIGNLTHIEVLNFSHNCLTGTIPATFSNMKSIESLDLSYNHLNGEIPSQLVELYSLAVFNLSYNNLSGRTPARKAQFSTFEWDSYVGNPLLCGEPLPTKCEATDSPPSTVRASINDIKEDSGFLDMYVFYMSFAGSYVTVVLAIVAILIINPYWRRTWFHLIEVSLTSCYYFIVDNLVGRRCFHWK